MAEPTEIHGKLTVESGTFVKAERDSDLTDVSAGDWVNAFDSASKDNESEFSDGEFTPDKGGYYEIVAAVDFRNTSEGDELDVRIRDVDNSDTLEQQRFAAVEGNNFPSYSFVVQLTGGTTYEVQARNADSEFDISSSFTTGAIRRCLIQ